MIVEQVRVEADFAPGRPVATRLASGVLIRAGGRHGLRPRAGEQVRVEQERAEAVGGAGRKA